MTFDDIEVNEVPGSRHIVVVVAGRSLSSSSLVVVGKPGEGLDELKTRLNFVLLMLTKQQTKRGRGNHTIRVHQVDKLGSNSQ